MFIQPPILTGSRQDSWARSLIDQPWRKRKADCRKGIFWPCPILLNFLGSLEVFGIGEEQTLNSFEGGEWPDWLARQDMVR